MSEANQLLELQHLLMSGQPWGRLDVPGLLQDPARIKAEFTRFLENGGRVMVPPKPSIDFDVDPFISEGWSIRPEDQIQSRLKGRWELLIDKIKLYLDSSQTGDKTVRGDKLKDLLEGQPVLPAHVLDYLLEHPDLIPESWKGKPIFFWGTIYCSSDGSLCVRCLYWDGGRWYWGNRWLDYVWFDYDPSAVCAS